MLLVANLFNGTIPGLQSRYLATLRDKYGPIVGFSSLGVNFVVCQEPEITSELFVKNGRKVNAKPADPMLDGLGGKYFSADGQSTGLAMAEGDRWRENRRFAMMTVFGADKIRKLDFKMVPEMAAFVEWLDAEVMGAAPSAIVDPMELFSTVTLNVIGSICADIRPNSLGKPQDPETAEFAHNLITMMRLAGGEQDVKTVLNRASSFARRFESFGFPGFLRY